MTRKTVPGGSTPAGALDKYLSTIRKRFSVSHEEEALLTSEMAGDAYFSAGDVIVAEGEAIDFSSLLFEGMSYREKSTVDGNSQIVGLHIPGDFVDLHSYPLKKLDHSLIALTDCRLVTLPHERIDRLMHESPPLARILWFSTMADASIHREWILNLGSRRGSARIGHLFCEMYCRMTIVGLVKDDSFAFPLTQHQLGDALGFTQIHVNRILRELREANLAVFNNGRVTIKHFDRLAKHSGFEPDYLFVSRRTA